MSSDSFGARSTLEVGGRAYEVFRLDALADRFDVSRLPYSIKVLLENVLRLEDGRSVSVADVEAIAGWDPAAEPSTEIPFQPARVLMQDFTGVPAVVDLAAMRDAMAEIGGDPEKINPLVDVDLVIDHSVQVDAFGNERAFAVNAEREFERNRERYSFLKWGREAFDNFSVVPPATGICHQVNLEHIAQVVFSGERDGGFQAFPDTRRWSTGSACSAGAWAGSRPRRRCSASRFRCCCPRWWASGWAASCRPARPRQTWS
jgi:aconitate hydratase